MSWRSERPRLIVTEKVNETGSLHRIIEILHRECTLSHEPRRNGSVCSRRS